MFRSWVTVQHTTAVSVASALWGARGVPAPSGVKTLTLVLAPSTPAAAWRTRWLGIKAPMMTTMTWDHPMSWVSHEPDIIAPSANSAIDYRSSPVPSTIYAQDSTVQRRNSNQYEYPESCRGARYTICSVPVLASRSAAESGDG